MAAEVEETEEEKMRPLVINDQTLADVAKLIETAKTYPFDFPTMKKIAAGQLSPSGAGQRFVCQIPMGYRCVYTHETHPTLGRCRHLSVSVAAKGKGPGVEAMNEISKLFGFKEGINSADHRWVERLPDDGCTVNLLQKVIAGDET